ncbi:hypothetical protein [Flavivirga spongiicola]|uniref:Uncharacterized protein n=1 Tax=Flavivirga spongiicola TaxID=421621 RepID=A0ABU7XS36_9FLAO|nr:hypothetical protein [Flavivirga sp. MEBiC05379]MDO5978576.1 hypothetical protein [Flavivirga sp. MEBiC05379]
MNEIKSENIVRKIKNELPHLGKINLTLQPTDKNILEVEENYPDRKPSGFSQGQAESISQEGYNDWKQGIRNGIEYAYNKLTNNSGLKIIIESAIGLTTDTNPTIIGFSASRAILYKLPNCESQTELELLEEMVYSSWDYEFDAIPDFIHKTIIGKKLPTTRYKKT